MRALLLAALLSGCATETARLPEIGNEPGPSRPQDSGLEASDAGIKEIVVHYPDGAVVTQD